MEKRVRTTGGGATGSVRNLRIREDTAKYLLNLDPSSAHYDPKSRSMREDPRPELEKKAFAGDNFVRKSGDYHAWEAERMHQLEAYDHGATLHMQAAPSQAEILHQNFKVKKDKLQVGNHNQSWLLAAGKQAVCMCDPCQHGYQGAHALHVFQYHWLPACCCVFCPASWHRFGDGPTRH